MAKGRSKEAFVLSERERRQLDVWSRRRKTAQGLALCPSITLACSSGESGGCRHDYERHDRTTLLAALDIAVGKSLVSCTVAIAVPSS